MNLLSRTFRGVIDFALPPICICCGNVLSAEQRFICISCKNKLKPFDESHPWKDEYIGKEIIDDSFSLYWFIEGTEIQNVLHSMKYEKMKSIGVLFGKEIGTRIRVMDFSADYIIPVPLHKSRVRDRTYNQSEYIFKGINEILNIEILDDCLKRTRFTETQTHLNKQQRKQNMLGAFKINKKYINIIKDKNIILTDDVITTGATILECASILKSAGCAKLIVCSAAYAILD